MVTGTGIVRRIKALKQASRQASTPASGEMPAGQSFDEAFPAEDEIDAVPRKPFDDPADRQSPFDSTTSFHPDPDKDDDGDIGDDDFNPPPFHPLSSEEAPPAFYEVVGGSWGVPKEAFNPLLVQHLQRFARLETARETGNGGFTIDLQRGGSVSWGHVQEKGQDESYEAITCDKKLRFKMEQAMAMVALAKMHGWESIDAHGSKRQKELIWLAAQHMGMEVNNYEPKLNMRIKRQANNYLKKYPPMMPPEGMDGPEFDAGKSRFLPPEGATPAEKEPGGESPFPARGPTEPWPRQTSAPSEARAPDPTPVASSEGLVAGQGGRYRQKTPPASGYLSGTFGKEAVKPPQGLLERPPPASRPKTSSTTSRFPSPKVP
jgi:hypothetical protein